MLSQPNFDEMLKRAEAMVGKGELARALILLESWSRQFKGERRFGLAYADLAERIGDPREGAVARINSLSLDGAHQRGMTDVMAAVGSTEDLRKLLRRALARIAEGAEAPSAIVEEYARRGVSLADESMRVHKHVVAPKESRFRTNVTIMFFAPLLIAVIFVGVVGLAKVLWAAASAVWGWL